MTASSKNDWMADDHALLIEAVRAGGELAASYFGQDLENWMKRPGQPVSEADLAVDALLRDTLMSARPDYGWLSEESAESTGREEAERLWVVDPIDGTRAFLEGRPEYTVSVGLLENGRPVLGAVFNPQTGEFFEAVKGGGARCKGRTLHVGEAGNIENARILVSRGEFKNLASHDRLINCEISSISSIAYKIVLVAADRADATVSLLPKSDWDLAGADIILAEAGGMLTTADGKPMVYNQTRPRHSSVLAAGRGLSAELSAELADD